MSDTASRSSISAAVLVALAALVPLGWSLRPEPASESSVPAVEELQRTDLTVAPPPVEGLDPSISRVLYWSGDAEALTERDRDLAPEIIRVLVHYDVTLVVPAEVAP